MWEIDYSDTEELFVLWKVFNFCIKIHMFVEYVSSKLFGEKMWEIVVVINFCNMFLKFSLLMKVSRSGLYGYYPYPLCCQAADKQLL